MHSSSYDFLYLYLWTICQVLQQRFKTIRLALRGKIFVLHEFLLARGRLGSFMVLLLYSRHYAMHCLSRPRSTNGYRQHTAVGKSFDGLASRPPGVGVEILLSLKYRGNATEYLKPGKASSMFSPKQLVFEAHLTSPCWQSLSFDCSILAFSRKALHESSKIFIEYALHVSRIQSRTEA